MDIRIGSTLAGPSGKEIVIEALVGAGGFGQVFAGRLGDNTRVAVKTVLTSFLSDAELRAMQNESLHAVGLDHPNVVRVLHVEDGEAAAGRPPYLVMELVTGGNLRQLIERHQEDGTKVSPDDLRMMFSQIAEGMEAVNARVVHRDLKPENVLLDTAGVLKIADFGLAKLANAATRSETFKGWGTRAYQAPEAFDDGPNTPAMDMYAAGVMFFELAALTVPIRPSPRPQGPMAWRNAHLLTPPTDIRSLRPDLPLDLVQLIVQMLQKPAVKRPQSWAAVIARLKAAQPTSSGRDVAALVSKATSSFIRASADETRARELREQATERAALQVQAFSEPLGILQELVDAFNSESSMGTLTFTRRSPLTAEVSGRQGRPRILIEAQSTGDLPVSQLGIARVVALVCLEPQLRPVDEREFYNNRESFGGFNLVYTVSSSTERYGQWAQFRFEVSPLMRKMSFPRWFGVDLHALPRELEILRAMGQHQHEQRSLDDVWFQALLLQIV